MSAILEIDQETGEIIPQSVMLKTDRAPAIIIDIKDVELYHHEPEKLVDKIRTQASYAVFDISSQKGRDACRSHAANIIKCITPAMNASKALAADAQKVVKQDLAFRRIFETDVREIAEFHRKPLTEYEAEVQRVKDEFEAAEAAKLAEEARLKQEAEDEQRRIFEEEKAKLEAEKLAIEQEKQRLIDERERMELEKKIRAEAEEQRIADEKRHAEQLARQAEEAEREAKEREEAARIAEENRLETIRLDALEKERQAALAPDKEKLLKLSLQIAEIAIPECGEEAKKVTDEVVILLGKVCTFIETRAAKL